MLIHIKVKDARVPGEHEHAFAQLPIRIGRNPLNDLIIDDPFVSQWHGVVRREAQRLTFMDLGSTNGSSLEGRRLPKDVAVPLGDGARLNVACFQLSLVAEDVPESGLDGATQIIRRVSSPVVPPATDALAKPACSNAPQAESCGEAASNAGRGPSREGMETLSGFPYQRCLRLLQGFSDALVALRNGHQEFGEQVGVRPITGSTPLHRARTGGEITTHLLDPSHSVDACLAELKAVFADLGIHQIALMAGIHHSVRSLLESLDPETQMLPAGRLARWIRSSRPLRQRLSTLIDEEEALHAEIFGEAFARAYASVALGPGQG